jgi:dTDP-4-amino-4,6-dideoxygalactose transaminase
MTPIQSTSMIPVAKPLLDEREVDAVRRVILSGWVTQGPEVAAFEREFAALVGAPHAVAVSNCTTALHLALLAVGIGGTSDEVITVSHSFIATANAIRYCGATPVFVDVDPVTFNIDPRLVEAAITPKTRAILCVHQLGMPCDLTRIVEIGKRRGLPVIEDAACAIGSEIVWNGQWEKIGKPHGDIACFSFHPRKIVTTGDGGMLTTANPEYDRRFRLWRQHSMSVSDTTRHGSRDVIFETYPEVGFNYRMTDLQAAVGRVQLSRLPEIIAHRRHIAAVYEGLLSGILQISTPVEPVWARSNWQSYCVRLAPGLDQRAVMQRMLTDGVSARRGVMCSHREPPYRDHREALPQSERSQDTGIILPLPSDMTEADAAHVVDVLRRAVEAPGSQVSEVVDADDRRA